MIESRADRVQQSVFAERLAQEFNSAVLERLCPNVIIGMRRYKG